MNAITVKYHGGPYDGARERLDANALGLPQYQGFELPHLTSKAMHIYQCEFWDGEKVVDVHHVRVNPRKRPKKKKKQP